MFFDIEGSFSIAKVTSAESLVGELPVRMRRGEDVGSLRLDDMISVRGMKKQSEAVDNINITAKKLLIVIIVDFRLMK